MTVIAMGFFVEKKMTVDELYLKNLEINQEILNSVTNILDEVKDLKVYLKYD